ncbi:hypothetical protein PCK2_000495, partial [Pneumocystis canis]
MFNSDVLDTDFYINERASPGSQKMTETISRSKINQIEDFCNTKNEYRCLTGNLKSEKQPYLVRALYDFNSPELSSLNFVAGDIIKVLNKLENGWWDGILGNQRGWFPSNYVEHLKENELNSVSSTANSMHNESNFNLSDSDDGSSLMMPIYYCPQISMDLKDLETKYLNYKPLKLLPEELIPSYRKILQNIHQSVSDLNKFILLNAKILFQKLCDSLRITIIYLIHASNMLKNVSLISNSFQPMILMSENDIKTIKWYYRKILITLSKFIFSIKLASSEWLPKNINVRVLNDAEDMAAVIQEYIEFIMSKDSTYKTPSKIRLGFIKDRQIGGNWKGNGLIIYTKATVRNNMLLESEFQSPDNSLFKLLSQELFSKLDTSLSDIKNLLNKFQKRLLKPNFTESEKKVSTSVSETLISANDFFDLLVKRFMISPPENLKSHEVDIWVEKKQKPIRLRVFNILKIWLESYFMEPIDEDSRKLLNRIKEFTVNILSESIPTESLIRVINKRIKNEDEIHFRKLILNINLDPLEIARQLTIIESKIYNKIKPAECLNKAWSK